MILRIDCPIMSAAVQPNILSAARFHDVTMPSRSLLMMASSDESTMAARSRATSTGNPDILLGLILGEKENAVPTLAIIIASTRGGRCGVPVAEWFFGRAQAHGKFTVELIDLKQV